MKSTKLRLLQSTLVLGGLCYIIGAVVHFFGLTLFPFYDGKLYTPYHDAVLALVGIVLSLILFTIARNPVKNIDILNAIIIACFIAIIFSLWIIWKIDFVSLGAPAKKLQTFVEMILLGIFATALILLKPKRT